MITVAVDLASHCLSASLLPSLSPSSFTWTHLRVCVCVCTSVNTCNACHFFLFGKGWRLGEEPALMFFFPLFFFLWVSAYVQQKTNKQTNQPNT